MPRWIPRSYSIVDFSDTSYTPTSLRIYSSLHYAIIDDGLTTTHYDYRSPLGYFHWHEFKIKAIDKISQHLSMDQAGTLTGTESYR